MITSATIGPKISGAGHGVLLVGMLIGGLFDRGQPPEEVLTASVITNEEFQALFPSELPPSAETSVAAPSEPDVDEDQASASTSEDPPVPTDPPDAEEPNTPDAVPETPELPVPPDPELSQDTPEIVAPETPEADAPIVAPEAEAAAPQEAPRVAPIPVPESPPTPEIADEPAPPVSENSESAETTEDQPEAAPEEATTEIVTEAETPGAGAPQSSVRPSARPVRPASAEPETETEPEPADNNAAINDALADALTDVNETPAPSVPSGPPLTAGEKDGLRIAVQNCWNTGSLSSDALLVTVVISVQMFENGKPDTGSIRMRSFEGGPETAARQAYEAARRAIIRCGTDGYDLPIDKYEQWREIEMTFNPEKMRIK